MATHYSILAWEIPRTEEPGSLQSIESQRVGHYLATEKQLKWHPLQRNQTSRTDGKSGDGGGISRK